MVHKIQMFESKEKETNGAVTKGSDEIEVMYTNINGIITRKLELVYYLQEKKQNYVRTSRLTLRMIIIIYGVRIEKIKKVVV